MKISKKQIRTDIWGWFLVSPLIIGLAVFTVYPLIMSILYSFFDVSLVKPLTKFGLQNYKSIFTGMYAKDFFHALKITFTYAIVQVPLGLILGYLLALFLTSKVKGNNFLLVLYYLPTLIPGVVSGSLWGDMFNERYGIFNNIIQNFLGLDPVSFMSAENLMASYIWMTTFGVGGGSIIWVAGLKSVDKTYYEAATLDGAGVFAKFINITLPLTTPYIFYNLVMGIISALQLFNSPYILTGGDGGAEKALLTVQMLIYNAAFPGGDKGEASAMAWVLCAIIAILTLLVFRTNKWVHYEDE